jgi:hypothetical protein
MVSDAVAKWALAQATASLAPAISHLAAAHILQQQQQQQVQAEQHRHQEQQRIAQQEQLRHHQQKEEQQRNQLQQQLLDLQRQHEMEQRRQQQLQPVPPANQALEPALQLPHQTQQGPPLSFQEEMARLHARQLKETYENYLKKQSAAVPSSDSMNAQSSTSGPEVTASSIHITSPAQPLVALPKTSGSTRTEEDQADGNVLLNFLGSLRESYEEALRQRNNDGGTETNKAIFQSSHAISVAESENGSSDDSRKRVTESSVEDSDWNSDKKTDPSSSEESDKDSGGESSKAQQQEQSRGPPRKRMKAKNTNEKRRLSL